MTQEQLQNTLKIPVRPASDIRSRADGAIGPLEFDYQLNSFLFHGKPWFRDNALLAISLHSEEPGACDTVQNVLTTSYGAPDLVKLTVNGATVTLPLWLDRPRGNQIRMNFIKMINYCDVTYEPLPTSHDRL
jgi:hypothetical protein